MGKTILVIGDAHAHPDFPNTRFDWLGKMIVAEHPDVIVDIGDFADMPSLSSYDFGKKSYEGRRYLKDIECAIDARKRVKEPADELSARLRKQHGKHWEPRFVALGGNHDEARITRTIACEAMLDGLISHWDLGYRELGWEYVPFGDTIDIEGICFTHYFMGGVMGKPLGGLYPTVTMLKRFHQSCVQGHTHYFQMRHEVGPQGKVYAFMAGCYFDYNPEWTKAHIFYDRGILLLKDVDKGNIGSFSWVGIDEIKRRYG